MNELEAVGFNTGEVLIIEDTDLLSESTPVIIGNFRRGRLDRHMLINKQNIRAQLGHDPRNLDYNNVCDALESMPAVYVMRILIDQPYNFPLLKTLFLNMPETAIYGERIYPELFWDESGYQPSIVSWVISSGSIDQNGSFIADQSNQLVTVTANVDGMTISKSIQVSKKPPKLISIEINLPDTANYNDLVKATSTWNEADYQPLSIVWSIDKGEINQDGSFIANQSNQLVTVTVNIDGITASKSIKVGIQDENVIELLPFDFAVIRYSWTESDGRDFDTRTQIIQPERLVTVGWNKAINDEEYLKWGSDNTQFGSEDILIGMQQLKADFPNQQIFEISLKAFWYSLVNTGNFSLEFVTYNGGTMEHIQTGFINNGGEIVQNLKINSNTKAHRETEGTEGVPVGKVLFNTQTNTGQLIRI